MLKKPNLPDNRVSLAAVSGEHPDILSALAALGVESVPITPNPRLPLPVSSHADLNIHHLGGGDIVCIDVNTPHAKILADRGFNLIRAEGEYREEYPFHIGLCALRLGGLLLGLTPHIDKAILPLPDSGVRLVPVKQGYTRCSVLVVNERAVITSDMGLYKTFKELTFDVLLIRPGYISLPGYDYGFIGGCAGLIAPDVLAFAGDANTHPDYEHIRAFLDSRGVRMVSLKRGILCDIGGILPLIG